MNLFQAGKLVLLLTIFAATAIMVVRGNPPGSPARKKRERTLWRVMVLIAYLAICLAIFSRLSSTVAWIVVAIVLLVVWNPYPLSWLVVETAATSTVLVWMLIDYTDLCVDIVTWLAILTIGLAVAMSWVLRMCLRGRKPVTRADWASFLQLPLSIVVAGLLLPTGVAFNLRLLASERALRACVGDASTDDSNPAGRVGLFWAEQVERRGGAFAGPHIRVCSLTKDWHISRRTQSRPGTKASTHTSVDLGGGS